MPQMLQIVNHLRRSGYFVGVALTKPFAFEGARKAEQADALVEAMEDGASLVVGREDGAGRGSKGNEKIATAL